MILGITPLLSIVRNLIQIGGFCIMFLLLDKPRYPWKKTILGYILYCGALSIVGIGWVLRDPASYKRFCVLVLFITASVFFLPHEQHERISDCL